MGNKMKNQSRFFSEFFIRKKLNCRRLSCKGKSFLIFHDHSHPITPYSRFFLYNFPTVKNSIVLDYGVGSGVLSIAASLLGAIGIYSLDIDPGALRLVNYNAIINNITNLNLILNKGDLKEFLKDKFLDLIISNPPSLPSKRRLPLYYNAGSLGNRVILEMIDIASSSLSSGGKLVFIHTSLVPQDLTRDYLVKNHFHYKIIATRRIKFRNFYYPLLSHLAELKKRHTEIYYDVVGGEYYEYLYLYEAIKN